jgi:predicted metal-dependent enzyme (double-stranded beta helix superfamily)
MNFEDLRHDVRVIQREHLPPTLAVDQLTELLHQFISRVKLASIQAFLESEESNSRYHRYQLSAPTDDFQIVLASWKPQSCSPVHDHDEATGAVATLMGSTMETKYKRITNLGQYSLLKSGQTQVLQGRTISPILPGDSDLQLHAMHNSQATWAATLHIYLHPLTIFNVYRPKIWRLYTRTSETLWLDPVPAHALYR